MQDALGWVFFTQGRYAEAEKELLQGYDLNPKYQAIPYHLGRLYEIKQDWPRAEESYIKGMMIPSSGENPNAQALKALYEKRHGNLNGYTEYVAKIADFDRTKRREKITASRISAPKLVKAFDLKAIHGESVSLGSLRGKITVINFWGVWCGWCVAEMPDFQKLSDKYKGDPEVAIVTINNDFNSEDVREWLKKHNYNFGILLDDGYVKDAGIRAFPTTWFLDKQGRLGFVQAGWSEKLLEEFSWRIEELRNSRQPDEALGKPEGPLPRVKETPFTVTSQIETASAPERNHAELVVTIQLASGYHINANKPDDVYLIPTVLLPKAREGVVWGTPIYPEGARVVRKFSSKPLNVYNGNVFIRVPLTVLVSAVSGRATVEAELQVQACNSETCLPPRKIAVSAVLAISNENLSGLGSIIVNLDRVWSCSRCHMEI